MCKDALLDILPKENQKYYAYKAYTYTMQGEVSAVYCPFCIETNYVTDQLILEDMDGNENRCCGCRDYIKNQYKVLKYIVESYSVEEWNRIVNVNSVEAVKKLLGIY